MDRIIKPCNLYYSLGPVVGFAGFVAGVVTMEGIFFRPDHHGDKKFQLEGFYEYLKLPFNLKQKQIAWATLPNISLATRLKLLNLNWVFMVGVGSACSLAYYYYNN